MKTAPTPPSVKSASVNPRQEAPQPQKNKSIVTVEKSDESKAASAYVKLGQITIRNVPGRNDRTYGPGALRAYTKRYKAAFEKAVAAQRDIAYYTEDLRKFSKGAATASGISNPVELQNKIAANQVKLKQAQEEMRKIDQELRGITGNVEVRRLAL